MKKSTFSFSIGSLMIAFFVIVVSVFSVMRMISHSTPDVSHMLIAYLLSAVSCAFFGVHYFKSSKISLALGVLVSLLGLTYVSVLLSPWFLIPYALQYLYVYVMVFAFFSFAKYRKTGTRMMKTDMFLTLSGVLLLMLLFIFVFGLEYGFIKVFPFWLFLNYVLYFLMFYFGSLFLSVVLSIFYFIKERKELAWKKSKLGALLLVVGLTFFVLRILLWH